VARETHHSAVAGGRYALPVFTPLTQPGVGSAAGAVGEAEALLVCAFWKRNVDEMNLLQCIVRNGNCASQRPNQGYN